MCDCGYMTEDKWFRYRAAAIIVEQDCILFACNEKEDYLYSVGGGVHHGESAEKAVLREVFEETGVHYEIDRLAVIHENFFIGSNTLKGIDCHVLNFYFLMKPRGTQELHCHSTTQGGVKEDMRWIPIKDLNQYKAYPTFLSEYLSREHTGIEHIITDERV